MRGDAAYSNRVGSARPTSSTTNRRSMAIHFPDLVNFFRVSFRMESSKWNDRRRSIARDWPSEPIAHGDPFRMMIVRDNPPPPATPPILHLDSWIRSPTFFSLASQLSPESLRHSLFSEFLLADRIHYSMWLKQFNNNLCSSCIWIGFNNTWFLIKERKTPQKK